MTKHMVIGDCHFTDPERAPVSRRGHWTEELFTKLEFIVNLASKQKCDSILQLGDLLHLKGSAQNSPELVQRLHDTLTANNLPVTIVAGNHELRHDDYKNDIPKHALGALGRMRGIDLLVGPSEQFPEVYGIPYLQDWATLPEWINEYNDYRDNHPEIEHGIIITHASFFPEKDAPIYDYVADEDVAEMLNHPTTVMHGHLHFQQGVRTYGDVQIINYGAISRGSLHKETLERQPQVYVFDTVDQSVTLFDVPVKPASEVFNLEPHLLEQERSQRLTGFLEGLDTSSSTVVGSLEQMQEHFNSQEKVSVPVKNTVSELLEHAQEMK